MQSPFMLPKKEEKRLRKLEKQAVNRAAAEAVRRALFDFGGRKGDGGFGGGFREGALSATVYAGVCRVRLAKALGENAVCSGGVGVR